MAEARSLLRALLRAAHGFPSYNVREYIRRRAVEGFRESRRLSGEEAAAALARGREELEVARRQKQVYALFAPQSRSVMEQPPAAK